MGKGRGGEGREGAALVGESMLNMSLYVCGYMQISNDKHTSWHMSE